MLAVRALERGWAWAKTAFAALACLAFATPTCAADGDPARGFSVFQRCYACHSVDPSEIGLPGPTLYGVFGRAAGTVPDFEYSHAFLARARQGLVWDAVSLDAFLADPQRFIPGNAMGFFGLPDPQDRMDLIMYLKTASGKGAGRPNPSCGDVPPP